MLFSQLPFVGEGEILQLTEDFPVSHLIYDSRKVICSTSVLFFAIKGSHHDGHRYISDLYEKGIRQFAIEDYDFPIQKYPLANFIYSPSSKSLLQAIAVHHRSAFGFPVVAITGSNGKTIVKEWLSQLLHEDFNLVKSPKSYNSQIGVPLSVWQINDHHNFGIFEAGISQVGEMQHLEKVIKPTIGIFTNIGSAHDEGFVSKEEKINEKLKLFREAEVVIINKDHVQISSLIKIAYPDKKVFAWSLQDRESAVFFDKLESRGAFAYFKIESQGKLFENFKLPFVDDASIENALHCIAAMLYLGYDFVEIQQRALGLQPIAMRLEVKKGINGCYLIDDSYNNDFAGLTIALDFLVNQTHNDHKMVILSDMLESGMEEKALYEMISQLLKAKNIRKVIGIGELISRYKDCFEAITCFQTTDDFLNAVSSVSLEDETILIKGARKFQFEKITEQLQEKTHGTVLEINLDALSANLNYYRSLMQPSTKIMVMVKAFAYGSGSNEVANLLQFHRIDYLAVAYADEGVELRKNGISLPIMVMNPSLPSFEKLVKYNLEPEIYSARILKEFLSYLKSHNGVSNIHIKLDTGMKRLGFEAEEVEGLVQLLKQNKEYLKVASIFSHLAGADESAHNDFSYAQIHLFQKMAKTFEDGLEEKIIKHMLNSAGIVRFPDASMDMVRLGIGLYGVEATYQHQDELQNVGTLKTIISQIKKVKAGETVGYSRKWKCEKDIELATIAIGYADGYDRRFSNGKGSVLVKGKLCPVIGNVCMDMTMIDVTGVGATEGEEVIVFGKNPTIQTLAKQIDTIPYEILTAVGERVKRVFYAE
jgi:Alr-MurF fusion protein